MQPGRMWPAGVLLANISCHAIAPTSLTRNARRWMLICGGLQVDNQRLGSFLRGDDTSFLEVCAVCSTRPAPCINAKRMPDVVKMHCSVMTTRRRHCRALVILATVRDIAIRIVAAIHQTARSRRLVRSGEQQRRCGASCRRRRAAAVRRSGGPAGSPPPRRLG
jgi:hypothetical protein